MDREIEIEKTNFYLYKSPIFLDVGINNILVSNNSDEE